MADGTWIGDPEMKPDDGWDLGPLGAYPPLGYSVADAERDRSILVHKIIEQDIIKLVGDEKTAALRSTERQITKFIKEAGSYYRLHNDFETYCEQSVVDIGADRYSRDPTCEVLLLAYGFNDDAVGQWRAAEGQSMPADLREALHDPYAIKFAWNKPFEYAIYKNVLGIEIPHRNWRDPMIMAMTCSLPGSLGKAGGIIGLPQNLKKDADGKRLIRIFCMPRKATKKKLHTRTHWWMEPEDWEHFCEYNVDDVWAERAMYRRLKPYDLPKDEWELWVIDQEINEAGIPINMTMVDNAAKIYDYVLEDRIAEMAQITGLDNPGSTQQLLPWLQNFGYPFEDCKKGHIERGLDRVLEQIAEGDEDPDLLMIQRVLELRLEASRTAPTKYAALQRAVDRETGVLRGAMQFAGAQRTWRWSGRMYQPQNLAKPPKYMEKYIEDIADDLTVLDPWSFDQIYTTDRHMVGGKLVYSSPMDALASGVRPVAQAPEGTLLIDCDLNAVENRVLGWMTNCPKILRVFELGRDPYVDFATYLFGGEYDALWAEYKGTLNAATGKYEGGNSFKRTISKPGVLGCGYQLGPGQKIVNRDTGEVEGTGLLGYAWNMGVKEFTPEQSKLSVDVFRTTFEEVVEFWYAIERAAKKCVLTGQPVRFRMLTFDRKGPFLRMILPSGRCLHYVRPRIVERETPWGAMKDTLVYDGLNDKNQWVEIKTHGGKLTENADQAMSRDLLASGMRIAKRRYKIDIRLHVHDQLVAVAPISQADEQLALLKASMEERPPWAFAGPEWTDLPLGSNGFTSRVFMKD